MKTAIINGKILTSDRELQGYALVFEGGKICGIVPAEEINTSDFSVIDAQGGYVGAGWIELHSHGIAGVDFMDADPEANLRAMEAYAEHGVTGVFPTTLSAPFPEIRRALDALAHTDFSSCKGAELLGIHLEGPYFSREQRGAQPLDALSTPQDLEYVELIKEYPFIRRIDTAPELSGSAHMAQYLREKGVICGIAHTDADATVITQAEEGLYPIATHLYSGMSGVHRVDGFRRAGAVEGCLLRDDIYCEAICDGIHLPPELLKLVYKVKGADKMILVSDSVRGADLPEETGFVMGNKETGTRAISCDGVAWLPDRSAFAGSVATFDRLVRTAVTQADIPLVDAVKMSSLTPARAMGLSDKGALAEGYDADITVFDENINIMLTIVGGKIVYSKKEL